MLVLVFIALQRNAHQVLALEHLRDQLINIF